MEISKFCYQCKKYNTDKFVNDMADIEPSCFIPKKCGGCQFAEGIEGKDEVVGCTKLNVLKNVEDFCSWEGN